MMKVTLTSTLAISGGGGLATAFHDFYVNCRECWSGRAA